MHRIALVTLTAVIRAPVRGKYAAITRPDVARRPLQPSFAYRLDSLARRSALGREITARDHGHG